MSSLTSAQGRFLAVAIFCMVVSAVAVVLRLVSVRLRKAALAADDYVIVGALV